jgi:hypothetical protein
MTYNATYAAGDVSAAVIDNIVGILAAVFSFVSIVALVMLYRWLKGRKTM